MPATAPPTPVVIALSQLRGSADQAQHCVDYYEGRHRLAFATPKFRNAFGYLFREFADNLMPSVVDAVADKLSLDAFSSDTEAQLDEADGPAPEEIEAIWEQNRMARRAGEVHQDALKVGNTYVIVWPDSNGYPRITPQAPGTMTVYYDPDSDDPTVIAWAAKLWRQLDGHMRLNMYYPDRIEKWVTRGRGQDIPDQEKSLMPFETPGEAWPLVNPYGRVPVFHFANNAPIGGFGRSELADAMPLQDALNKSVLDMLVTAEFQAMPQRWATGVEAEYDDTGHPILPYIPGAEQLWLVASDTAKLGQFDAADMQRFIGVQDSFRQEIARVTHTPMHYLMLGGGQFPSGEAERAAETPFLAKIKDRQTAFGDTWQDLMSFAYLVLTGKPIVLDAHWVDAAPHSEKEHLEALILKKTLGVSSQQLLREAGYTDEDIARMTAEKQANAAQFGTSMIDAMTTGQGAGSGLFPGLAGDVKASEGG